MLIYKQMVLPVLDYSDFLLEGAPEDSVKPVQTVQNNCLRCVRKIRNPRDISRVQLHIDCNCKTLKERRDRNLLGIMYTYASDIAHTVAAPRRLRNYEKVRLKVQRPKGMAYRKSPLHRVQVLWNRLNADQHHLRDKTSFMQSLV